MRAIPIRGFTNAPSVPPCITTVGGQQLNEQILPRFRFDGLTVQIREALMRKTEIIVPLSGNVIYFPKAKAASTENCHQRGSWKFISIYLVSILFFAMCFVIDVVSISSRKNCNLTVRRHCDANLTTDEASLTAASRYVTRGRPIQR